ncbi:MAG: Uma2 family endonuclease [Ferruginibacter sp.]|nr:Uma2 family endonuclease [Cytophagales bacterium]
METATKTMTAGEYLAWEANQETRYEFFYGEAIAVPGSKKKHNKIIGNCYRQLADAVLQKGGEIYTEDIKLRVDRENVYTYPDVMVTCEPEDEQEEYFVNSPRLIIEVLSDSTAAKDRSDKLIYYRRLPELQNYLMVWQDQRRVEHYARNAEGHWLYEVYENPADAVLIADFGVSLGLSAIYNRVL